MKQPYNGVYVLLLSLHSSFTRNACFPASRSRRRRRVKAGSTTTTLTYSTRLTIKPTSLAPSARGGFLLGREWKQGGVVKTARKSCRSEKPRSVKPNYLSLPSNEKEVEWRKIHSPSGVFLSIQAAMVHARICSISWPSRFTFRLSDRSTSSGGRVMQCSSSAHRNDC